VSVVVPFLFSVSFCRISEKSENSHHAKIVNYNAFNEFLQMIPKHNFIGPFKLFLFIGWGVFIEFLEIPGVSINLKIICETCFGI
jgi:hypothetical protein